MNPKVEALIERLRPLYERTERYHAPTAFVAGFLWDSLTLKRVDKLSDNAILLAYLLGLGAALVLHHRLERDPDAFPKLGPHVERVEWVVQFLFGGLYSAYVVFYFKSAYIGRSLLFLMLLVTLMFANEFLSPAKLKERLRVAQYGLVAFSFLLFCIPVLTGYLGAGVFTAAVLGALALSAAVSWGMYRGDADLRQRVGAHTLSTGGLLLSLYGLDFLGIIPPIPLAIMESGVFHHVQPDADGYVLRYVAEPWRPWRQDDRRFEYAEGDRVWCFTAVFSPSNTALDVVHVWQRWDREAGEWLTSDRIPFDVTGGRDGGYRAYTWKRRVQPGEWRVQVETGSGRVLGYVPFAVVEAEGERAFKERRYK
ncbi:MAG: DUF2914 domain-containing protein [Alphaproteobacteria bacterium]|nr:DUF2914 domain-containing protein [Alphaproteobacteria bacterium]